MCGRYELEKEEYSVLNQIYEADWVSGDEWIPKYNIPPGTYNPVVDRESPNKIELMKWGLIPSWAKDSKIGFKLINARSETVAEKPSFRKSFKTRRCLIPSSGFYEWDKKGGTRKPYRFFLKKSKVFSMAGLWDEWKNPLGEIVRSYTILTTTPNKIVEPYHDRMPVILEKNAWETWLNHESTQIELLSLLKPYPSNKMDYYEISTLVNNPNNQSAEIIKKLY